MNSLCKNDITELKSLASPPVMVKQIVELVAIILDEKDLEWSNLKKMLGRSTFLNQLAGLNPMTLHPLTLKKIKIQVEACNLTVEQA